MTITLSESRAESMGDGFYLVMANDGEEGAGLNVRDLEAMLAHARVQGELAGVGGGIAYRRPLEAPGGPWRPLEAPGGPLEGLRSPGTAWYPESTSVRGEALSALTGILAC